MRAWQNSQGAVCELSQTGMQALAKGKDNGSGLLMFWQERKTEVTKQDSFVILEERLQRMVTTLWRRFNIHE